MYHRKKSNIIRAQLSEFSLPPVVDGVVLGRSSSIGHVAISKALSLLTTTVFEHLQLDDDVVSGVIIRTALLRKISKEQLIDFVLQEIQPIMGAEEIIHLDLTVEVLLGIEQL